MEKTNTHKTKENGMKKIEMVKALVKYMGGYDELPKETHPEVKKSMRFKKSYIKETYETLNGAGLI